MGNEICLLVGVDFLNFFLCMCLYAVHMHAYIHVYMCM